MKFGKHLAQRITPEWRTQYLKYEFLKDVIYESVENCPPEAEVGKDGIKEYYLSVDDEFFEIMHEELNKINTFFAEKLAEATRKFAMLRAELGVLLEQHKSVTTIASAQSEDLAKEKEEEGYGNIVPYLAKLDVLNISGKRTVNHHYTGHNFFDNLYSPADKKTIKTRNIAEMKIAFSEYYLGLVLLQNYQTLNFQAFRKILKKHDKLFDSGSGNIWRQDNVETAPFYINKMQIDRLMKDTEKVFTNKLEAGDRSKAMKRLRVPPFDRPVSPWVIFRVGFWCGIFLALFSTAVIAASWSWDHDRPHWLVALRLFRSVFTFLFLVFGIGINVWGWRHYGVNHVLIFELNPRDNLAFQQLMAISSLVLVAWVMAVVVYLLGSIDDRYSIPVLLSPFVMILFMFFLLLNPFRVFYFTSRRWLLRVLFRVFTAPFHKVGFADFWMADQLNSLASALPDTEFFLCFYGTNFNWNTLEMKEGPLEICGNKFYASAIILALPAWFRFAQCLRRYRDSGQWFPHLVNAGKYSTSFFVIIFSTIYSETKNSLGHFNYWFYVYIFFALVSTAYTFTWDVKMDWSLGNLKQNDNWYLRSELIYPYKWYYYGAIIQDLFLRLGWVISVTAGEFHFVELELLKTILAPLEVYRRVVWNFFRLENEHVNNCGQFRAVRDISIVVLEEGDMEDVEKYIGEVEGNTFKARRATRRVSVMPSQRYQKKEIVADIKNDQALIEEAD